MSGEDLLEEMNSPLLNISEDPAVELQRVQRIHDEMMARVALEKEQIRRTTKIPRPKKKKIIINKAVQKYLDEHFDGEMSSITDYKVRELYNDGDIPLKVKNFLMKVKFEYDKMKDDESKYVFVYGERKPKKKPKQPAKGMGGMPKGFVIGGRGKPAKPVEEEEDEDDEDFTDIEHEGVKYSYDEDNIVYDHEMEQVGTWNGEAIKFSKEGMRSHRFSKGLFKYKKPT
jgi:hypothetical protein